MEQSCQAGAVVLERLRRLARHLDTFEAEGFVFGRWEPARKRSDGVIVMGWFEPGPEAQAFFADAATLVRPFDWSAWLATTDGRRFVTDPDAVAGACADDLVRLLTALIRSQRFNDASWEGAYESGLLVAIMRRAEALVREVEGGVPG